MSRLTDKISLGKYGRDNMELFGYDNKALPNQEMHCSVLDIFNKLGELEDIEEELGIDLITYFKIKVGTKVYTNLLLGDDLIIDKIFGSGKDTCYHIVPRNFRSGVYVKPDEYGRNWALTREELENE